MKSNGGLANQRHERATGWGNGGNAVTGLAAKLLPLLAVSAGVLEKNSSNANSSNGATLCAALVAVISNGIPAVDVVLRTHPSP